LRDKGTDDFKKMVAQKPKTDFISIRLLVTLAKELNNN
jgi:hypothetical protein